MSVKNQIECLHLSGRTYNALIFHNITTVEKLLLYNSHKLKNLQFIGRKSYKEIKEKVGLFARLNNLKKCLIFNII